MSFYVVQNPYRYVSVNGLKSCMTSLLYLLDKTVIKTPIKMHSKPSYTRNTAFCLDMLFVMLRPTRNMVLSCYVLLNFALQGTCKKCHLCQLQQDIQGFNKFDSVKLRKARILKLFFTAFN